MLKLGVQEIREMLKAADAEEFAVLKRNLEGDERKGVLSALTAAEKRLEEENAEAVRVQALFDFDADMMRECGVSAVLGLDEVGRGCLAGPVAVGGVVLPVDVYIERLNDSKQIKPEIRAEIHDEIADKAIACVVEYSSAAEIDSLGIVGALKKAFSGAIKRIESEAVKFGAVLLDGNPLGIDPREVNIIKGDAKSACIAAASVFAKVERDRLMIELDREYPGYELSSNKGYGTKRHIELIHEHGLCDIHRRSFCGEFMQESLF